MRTPEHFESGQLALAVRTRTVTEQELPADKLVLETDQAWTGLIKSASSQKLDAAAWFIECLMYAQIALQHAVDVDAKRRGGMPVLKGTRFTVAQALAELAESDGVREVAERCTLREEDIRALLFGLSSLVERPWK